MSLAKLFAVVEVRVSEACSDVRVLLREASSAVKVVRVACAEARSVRRPAIASGSDVCAVLGVGGFLESPAVVMAVVGSTSGCSGLKANCLDKLAARSASFASGVVNTMGTRLLYFMPHTVVVGRLQSLLAAVTDCKGGEILVLPI